jgi:hypothetical protein
MKRGRLSKTESDLEELEATSRGCMAIRHSRLHSRIPASDVQAYDRALANGQAS